MIPLNLPSYPIKLAGTRQKPSIFDILRRKYVALTPEEWVRQHFVHLLIEHKGYPSSLLANEVSLKIGDKSLRADTVLYDRNLQPRMIIEYKAPSIPLTTHVLNQVGNYNRLLHVDYVIISNGLQHYCCKMDYASQRFVLLEDIPPYQEMKD
ncbi:MAG: type I restriction enzyme HsdR N-terminal domain-containing protein [Prevotella sp.]|nr:type I restriction enzyme HsdR N-terminal domain-containing protein [Prevotella sp.]